ncbi:MAG TPA: alpha-glucan family phosphorylase, partial [Candidatus Elarobacter sp.]
VASDVATYSGGLGVLAGDMIRAAADGGYPMAGVTLLYRDGYFRQRLDEAGRQREEPQPWRPEDGLERLPTAITVTISGRPVVVGAWRYAVVGCDGHLVPVYFLDTDREENDAEARALTRTLYGGDARYRLEQEALLGLATPGMLRALGEDRVATYHLNEGHAALLALALLERARLSGYGPEHDLAYVRERCVFTTHTPVAAGHDRFGLDLAEMVLGPDRVATLRHAGLLHDDTLNMSWLALRTSRYANAVAMRHGEVARTMFPGMRIDSITNGVHGATWAAPAFRDLFDRRIPGWRRDNFALRQAIGIPLGEIAAAHGAAKRELFLRIEHASGRQLDPERFTIGCARRSTAYKRNDLILRDRARLAALAQQHGGLQLVFAGKAHPKDADGKEQIARIVRTGRELAGIVDIVFVEGYDMTWGAALTAGVDLWLNTPRPPLEASGTSGMKAALNGVPSLSVVDGWWCEAAPDGVGGWSIDAATGDDDGWAAHELYTMLQRRILPAYAKDHEAYLMVMRGAIAFNGSHFNAQRMLAEYAIAAYDTSAIDAVVPEAKLLAV